MVCGWSLTPLSVLCSKPQTFDDWLVYAMSHVIFPKLLISPQSKAISCEGSARLQSNLETMGQKNSKERMS